MKGGKAEKEGRKQTIGRFEREGSTYAKKQ